MGASPVCRPGLPEDVPDSVTPAVPVGVFAAAPPAPTTVTAVTTDWLPLGSVLVCTTVLVMEVCVLLPGVSEPAPEGVMVCTPPPTVETMTRPTLLVLVTTSPRVRGAEEVEVAEGEVAPGDPPADVDVDGVEPEPEPAAMAPLDEAPVDVGVDGVLSPPAAGVAVESALGLGAVVEEVSPP